MSMALAAAENLFEISKRLDPISKISACQSGVSPFAKSNRDTK